MAHLIQKEHEIICSGCGCVLKEVEESTSQNYEKSINPISIDIFLLGSAIEKNVKMDNRRDRQQFQEEKVLKRLVDITKQFSLPDSIAYDTFNQLKKNKRGFHSESEPIKQLVKILSKDDNYGYFNKLKAIKARYAELLH